MVGVFGIGYQDRTTSKNKEPLVRRIAVLVVHGIGEQKRFEFLETVASNLYRALRRDPRRRAKAYIELRRGDQITRGADASESWHTAPAIVGWQVPAGEGIEVQFREVYWADLDLPASWRGTFKLLGWALGISGLRFFTDATVGSAAKHGMCEPSYARKGWARLWVRARLFLVSLLFFYIVISVFLLDWLLLRRISLFNDFRRLVHNYLGDVKLYQDWFTRNDDRLETVGKKSRVAIRSRMIRALIGTAAQVHGGRQSEKLDGYYILSHSLGTVVAFNGLMETALALPNYLSKEQWTALPAKLKQRSQARAPKMQMPVRAPWLKANDAIHRGRLFDGLEGFVTMGSPLDKFAALWPCIVRINGQAIDARRRVPWINVTDLQDIVGSSIDLFDRCPPAQGIGGLEKTEVGWADQLTLASAHTSYWTAKRHSYQPDRLIEKLLSWFEGNAFERPQDRMPPTLAKLIYWASLIVLPAVILLAFVSLLWWIRGYLPFPNIAYMSFLGEASYWALIAGFAVVTAVSLGRWLWERLKLGKAA
jgi:hypothetical protein